MNSCHKLNVFRSLACGLGAALMTLGVSAYGAESLQPFNGKDLTGWKPRTEGSTQSQWKVGTAQIDPAEPKRYVVKTGGNELINDTEGHGKSLDLYSTTVAGDAVITLEVMVPKSSNSGIYVMGEYEIQVLDSHGKDNNPGPGDMGAIYGAKPPKNPKYRAPGEWNAYEIHWQAPRFNSEGKKTANAKFVKVILNGNVIHENLEGDNKGINGNQNGRVRTTYLYAIILFTGFGGPFRRDRVLKEIRHHDA